MKHGEQFNLTHHCCRCNKVQLADVSWLPAVIVRILGIKESHGFCPECLTWQMDRIDRRHMQGMAV